MRGLGCLLALLAVPPALAVAAGGSVTVRVQVPPVAGLTFSRAAPADLTVTTPWGVHAGRWRGGALYAPDPQHYWSRLNAAAVSVPVPPGTPAGTYPVRVNATLYVCDQRAHLCSVRPAQASGSVRVGPGAPGSTVTLGVPSARTF
ncbi:hypothetical protein [Deinococcus aquiradiocola]|uniref:hypothetical protein n=1 Tax=Deinococcus aquiradiocola TaxID=393059 RepID=UPI00166D1838|nr:hypothetical protein [Deinococcus aquiradiocola]